ncbi:uncharacterized protein VTP21DRAFT_8629 [Calcarisporiella thermophila]|uniref:uncharacterized protein n=1 Tax=Calcarisporiella thermophila TaxID=911321 RepID=UPI0037441063
MNSLYEDIAQKHESFFKSCEKNFLSLAKLCGEHAELCKSQFYQHTVTHPDNIECPAPFRRCKSLPPQPRQTTGADTNGIAFRRRVYATLPLSPKKSSHSINSSRNTLALRRSRGCQQDVPTGKACDFTVAREKGPPSVSSATGVNPENAFSSMPQALMSPSLSPIMSPSTADNAVAQIGVKEGTTSKRNKAELRVKHRKDDRSNAFQPPFTSTPKAVSQHRNLEKRKIMAISSTNQASTQQIQGKRSIKETELVEDIEPSSSKSRKVSTVNFRVYTGNTAGNQLKLIPPSSTRTQERKPVKVERIILTPKKQNSEHAQQVSRKRMALDSNVSSVVFWG